MSEGADQQAERDDVDMSLPEWLRQEFAGLNNEVLNLTFNWQNYESLFRKGSLRQKLLLQTAPSFFSMLFDILRRDILLTLLKLDEDFIAVSGKQGKALPKKGQTLSIHNLFFEIRQRDSDASALETLERCRESYHESVEQMVPLRGNVLAHFNRKVMLNQSATAILVPAARDMEKMIADLHEFMKSIYLHYAKSGYCYKVVSAGDAAALVEMLKRAVRYHELMIEQKIDWTDFKEFRFKNA